jgi:5-hydroxyisourate hydrolase
MSVSTHVLDASSGRPATGVAVSLSRFAAGGTWLPSGSGTTDADGRLRFTGPAPAGVYRVTFGTGAYFAARGTATFYPEVVITFTVGGEGEHFHVPLLLSPFAYSTYRGS